LSNAVRIIREAFHKRKEIQVKGGVDLVTETDKVRWCVLAFVL
jgi:hypothetical protein